MQLLKTFVLALMLFPTVGAAHEACKACPSNDLCAYPRSDYKVDNACVDFCLDYEHNLSECQQACSN